MDREIVSESEQGGGKCAGGGKHDEWVTEQQKGMLYAVAM
jgi:hypothetical protein